MTDSVHLKSVTSHLPKNQSALPQKFLPRDAGLFSNVNFLVGEMHSGGVVFPLFSMDEKLNNGEPLRQFAYLSPACPNSWMEFFEPLTYGEGDNRHLDTDWVRSLPPTYGLQAAEVFRVPSQTVALYKSADFSSWRRSVHLGLAGRLRPSAVIGEKVEGMMSSLSGHRIRVHVRHPSHQVEQGRVFFSQYFEVIDHLCEQNPDSSIFLATDNELAIATFVLRYGERVHYYPDFSRESIDSILEWAYSLLKDKSDEMGFVSGVGFQSHYRAAVSDDLSIGLRMGREAVADVFSLAQCHDFVCTASNFTLACAYLNPDQRQHLISAGPPGAKVDTRFRPLRALSDYLNKLVK